MVLKIVIQLLRTLMRGVPVAEIYDPRLVFYIALLPTHPLRHIASHNDIHNISSLIFIKRLPGQHHSNAIMIYIMIFIIYLAY